MPKKPEPRGWGSITPYRGTKLRVRIWIDGERVERILPTRDLAQATLAALRRRKVEVESGVSRPAGMAEDVRVKDVIPELLETMAAGTRRVYSEKTLRSYRSEFKALDAAAGNRRIVTLKQRDVDAMVAKLRADGMSTSHVRHILDRLSQVIDHAVRASYISAPPFPVGRPKYRPSTVSWMPTEMETARLVAAARADHDRRALPAVLLAADAGLRVGEVANLRVADIDLDRGVIHVESRGETSDSTKSGDRRVVPILTRRLLTALAAACRRKPQDERILSVVSRDGLDGVAGKAWLGALGIEPRWHGLRRRFATWRALAGDPLPLIQRWLGHRSIATTMLYVRVPDESLLRGAIGVRRPGAEPKKRADSIRRGGRVV